ncbi:hypothetical protein BJX62DRAFT_245222 [Aspergillus germanicus]
MRHPQTTRRRSRTFTRRSRTGCDTCKIRRVKCDETPGSCRNCTSTGRQCDGYELAQLPRQRASILPTISSALAANNALPGRSADERRCFHVFQTRTIPMFVSLFESDLWRVVLQMSQSDPSVCHAVVAFSALHEETLICHLPAMRTSRWDFALQQYGRALRLLVRRLGSNDPQLKYVILVCCIIFVLFELLNGNHEGVLVHLQNGVNVLANTLDARIETARASLICGEIHPSGPNNAQLEVVIRRTIAHLDVQSGYFDRESRFLNIYPCYGDPVNLDYCTVWFDSLYGAKETLDPLLNNVLCIWRVGQPILRNMDGSEAATAAYEYLLAERHRMWTYLARHVAAFNDFLLHHPPATDRDRRSRDVILLHHLVFHMNIKSCVCLFEMIFDEMHAEWTKLVNLIHRIVNSAITEFGYPLPNIVFDVGITLPLNWAVLKCRDPVLRQRALDLQRLWLHLEGLHSTVSFMNVGQQVADIERAGMDPVTGLIPEEARIRTVNIEIDKYQRRGKLVYSLSDPTAEELAVRERWFDYDDGVAGYQQQHGSRSSSLRPRQKPPSEASTSLSTPNQ